MSRIEWRCLRFAELSSTELYALLRLRAEVFVVEQECVYQDLDDRDQNALHVIATRDEQIILYARLLPPGAAYEEASIGRILCASTVRGQGMGRELVTRAIRYARSAWPGHSIRISAQQYLLTFYEGLGFVPVTQPYLEDGIPHIEMLLD